MPSMRSLFLIVVLATVLTIVASTPISEVRDDTDSEDVTNASEMLNIEDASSENTSESRAALTDSCKKRASPCKAGQYLDDKCRCRLCPNGMTSPYSPVKPYTNVGVNSCRPCKLPFRIFKCPRFLSKNCRYLRLCVKPGDRESWTELFEAFQLPKFAVKMIPLMYSDIYEAPSFKFRTKRSRADPEQTVEDAQNSAAACEVDSAGCCLPGYYGQDRNSCTECPPEHSSAYSVPKDDCSCPNNDSSSCVRCNICEVLDASRQCTSKCKTTQSTSCSLKPVKVTINGKTRTLPAGTCYNGGQGNMV